MKRNPTLLAAIAASLVVIASCAPAERTEPTPAAAGVAVFETDGSPLPSASPAEVAMSADDLALIRPAMQRLVDAGELPGVMAMVARRGRLVLWEAVGMRDVAARDPLERDDIFRIYSMTKPITSTAVMMLVESGDVALDDPVAKFIPAFANPTVLTEDGRQVAAARPITVKDLLTHSGGLTYGFFEDTPVDRMYREEGLFESQSLEDFVTKAAGFPLRVHPGDRWIYSVSADVLGYVVQVASARPFEEFLEERVFEPLGMEDTAFWVPEEKRERFAAYYRFSEEGLQEIDSEDEWSYLQEPPFASGGGGLVSTASDYMRFAQMLLGEGQLDGVRVLRADTVRAMRQDQLPDGLAPISLSKGAPPAHGFGFGFGILIDEDATPEADHNGLYRWAGLANTYFWIDPEAELIGMAWTQVDPFGVHDLRQKFRVMVYAALEN